LQGRSAEHARVDTPEQRATSRRCSGRGSELGPRKGYERHRPLRRILRCHEPGDDQTRGNPAACIGIAIREREDAFSDQLARWITLSKFDAQPSRLIAIASNGGVPIGDAVESSWIDTPSASERVAAPGDGPLCDRWR
jgi:hypothetical protein